MRNAKRKSGLGGWIAIVIATAGCLLPCAVSFAAPTQSEVFRSIQQNVGQQADDSSRGMVLLMCAAGGLILVLLVGSKLRRRQSSPRIVDHPRKLIREVMKTVPLKAKEVKQLKLLAEETRQDGAGSEPVQHALTLILCPSVLARSIKSHPAKIDRAVVGQLVRKMGVGTRE